MDHIDNSPEVNTRKARESTEGGRIGIFFNLAYHRGSSNHRDTSILFYAKVPLFIFFALCVCERSVFLSFYFSFLSFIYFCIALSM